MPHLVRVPVRATLRAIAAAGLPLAWVAPLAAQLALVPQQWNIVPRHLPNAFGTAVWDEHRRRVVLVEGFPGRTWEWDGSDWFLHAPRPGESRPPLGGIAAAYDAARRQVVAFGTDGLQPQTWVFDGVDWQRRFPANTPSARYGPGMAYDAARQRVLLTGGLPGWGETWTWDGTDWTRVQSRTNHRLSWCTAAYDASRQRIVAIGTTVAPREPQALWEWDGVDWVDRTPQHFSGSGEGTLAYDPIDRRCVHFHYSMASWDGTTWRQDRNPRWALGDCPRQYPFPRARPALVFDGTSGRMLMTGKFAETWHWRGAWHLTQTSPKARYATASVYHAASGEIILFGGFHAQCEIPMDDCWAFDGWNWRELKTRRTPEPRWLHRMAYDSVRRETVMFGGKTDKFRYAAPSTWVLADGNWRERHVSPNPGERTDAAMAYDVARGRVVLFGGRRIRGNVEQLLRDTWEWDGLQWIQQTALIAPTEHCLELAYDAARQRIVGVGHFGVWEWDGQSWQAYPSHYRLFPAVMTYDPRLHRIVSVDQRNGEQSFTSWNGSAWEEFHRGSLTVGHTRQGMMHYHEVAGGLVYVQTSDYFPGLGTETYLIGHVPHVSPFGRPCSAAGLGPRVTATAPNLGRPCRIDILDARPQSLAALGLSATTQSTPIGQCTLLLGQPAWLTPLATDAAGFASALLPLPPIPGLRATPLYAQGFALDPRGSTLGLAFTAGLQLTLGD